MYGISMDRLPSNIAALDSFLDGGLAFGTIVEWGLPWGRGGRQIIRSFVAEATQKVLTLWVNTSVSDLRVYPPAWAAHGIDLRKIRFVHCEKPVVQLKPIFLQSLFKVIVLDAPTSLSMHDLAFLARQVRRNKQLLIVLRNYVLTPERGNVWAKMRLNCWQEAPQPRFKVEGLRGVAQPEFFFTPSSS